MKKFTDDVECINIQKATEWHRLAPLPVPMSCEGAVYFKKRILVVGGGSPMLAFHPPNRRRPWSLGNSKDEVTTPNICDSYYHM